MELLFQAKAIGLHSILSKSRLLITKLVAIAVFSSFTAGCYTPITDLKGYLPEEQVKAYPTVDSVLQAHFTPKALEIVSDIPTVEGWLATTGYAAGTSFGSKVMSLGLGTGIDRKVVFNKDSLHKEGFPGLIHEYIHHIDDVGRDDSEKVLINLEVFKQAYLMLSQDHKYKGIQRWCESRANDWVPNTFGVGENAEHLAYIAMFIIGWKKDKPGVLNSTPDYLRAVFGRVFKILYNKASVYTNIRGEQYLVTADPDKLEMVQIK